MENIQKKTVRECSLPHYTTDEVYEQSLSRCVIFDSLRIMVQNGDGPE